MTIDKTGIVRNIFR